VQKESDGPRWCLTTNDDLFVRERLHLGPYLFRSLPNCCCSLPFLFPPFLTSSFLQTEICRFSSFSRTIEFSVAVHRAGFLLLAGCKRHFIGNEQLNAVGPFLFGRQPLPALQTRRLSAEADRSDSNMFAFDGASFSALETSGNTLPNTSWMKWNGCKRPGVRFTSTCL
jgi:hypothetical protein